MCDCCCKSNKAISDEEIAAVHSALSCCLDNSEFKITSIISDDGCHADLTEVKK